MLIEWRHRGKPTALGVMTGAVAGLAAVTPASGFICPAAAMAIGAGVSIICYFAIMLKNKFRFDDSLDVFGVHGIGGIWGVLAVGLFAARAVNPAGRDGVFAGSNSFALLFSQLKGIAAVGGYSFIATFILLKLVGLVSPLRVESSDEDAGLDLSQHGEIGYHF